MISDNARSSSGPLHDDVRHPELEDRLATLFQSEPPLALREALDRWVADARRTSEPAPALARPILLPPQGHRRLANWATAAAASLSIVVVLATVASATGLIEWGRYFQDGFGTERIAEEDLGTDLNLTEQVDGFTVTIGRVYADPYSVAMTIRVTPPEGLPQGSIDLRKATLYDETGQFLGGPGAQSGDEDNVLVRTFFNNPIPAGRTTVNYRYEIDDLRYFVQPVVEDGRVVPAEEVVAGTPCQREPPYRGEPSGQPQDDTSCYLIASQPLSFQFEVPLGPGLSVVPGKLIASNGTVATITQLSAGHIGASVDIEGVGPFASVSIETGGQMFPLATYGFACPYDATTRFNYTTDQPIPLDAGLWTVVISADPSQQPEQLGRSGELGPCPRLDVTGEWTFTVDPATGSVSLPYHLGKANGEAQE